MKQDDTGSKQAKHPAGGFAEVDAPSARDGTDLAALSIDTIRFLAADAVERAKSGHPGMPMGAAPMAYVLFTRHLRHNPADSDWPDRDRFVLSAGHGSMLLYAMLHLTGYDLPMEELKNFRQWGSKTPGHPENFLTPGVETTTGPLGQGFANAVGMAIAERHLATRLNAEGEPPLVDHYTYGICSDGDLMEGISHEAASLAGHLGLGKLIFLYDDNHISIDGSTDLAFSEDVGERFASYGWHVQHVEDGNDLDAIDAAIEAAKADTERPSILCVRTEIGYGSPNKQGTAAAHGAPLGEEEVRRAKRNLGWPEEKTFHVPEAVYDHMRQALERGAELQQEWNDRYARYKEAHPKKAEAFAAWMAGELPDGWEEALPTFEAGTKMATRKASGAALDAIGPHLPHLVGGSADLTPSNKTDIDGRADFQKETPEGQYFRFGVREHAMAGAANGMVLHGGLRPYVATFLIFSDYLRPSLRLASLMELPVIYVFTHDSIGLGEDGPTHQPIEHLAALRAIPGLTLIRPADANETAAAWRAALENTEGPTALVLTRQGVPTIDRSAFAGAEGLHKGAYVLADDGGVPDVLLMATGSEVQHALAAAVQLGDEDGLRVRVVSMPSWELFEQQPASYRQKVLPPDVDARLAIEAGVPQGWERYVGPKGRVIGIGRFGASAPGATNMEKFGFTAENVVQNVRELMQGRAKRE